jgi:surfactin synthase thioesterase subunit
MTKINLFCLPFAGGSKYSYRGYVTHAPENINVYPIELPGRGARIRESLLTDIHAIVDDVLAQIEPMLWQNAYAIYGHSMGTLVGYLLTKRILEKDLPPPLHLFLTGRGGPSVMAERPLRHKLPKPEFLQQIRELGGSPDDTLNDDNLMEFFEPILRADFQAIETYEHVPGPPLPVSITAIIGVEERTTYAEAMAWQKETSEKLDVRQFPGKHFFIFNYEPELMKIIEKKLAY